MILSIILGIALGVCIFVIINLLRKTEKMDDELTNASLQIEDMVARIIVVKKKMNDIDSKGWFEKDDETGTVFKGIDNLITQVYREWDVQGDSDKNEK